MSSREVMEKLQLKINFNFKKTEIFIEVFKNKVAEYGKNEFDNLNMFTWKMYLKKSKHPDYLNLYLKGPSPANTIVRTFKIWKVNPIEHILLDFAYDSVQDLWKCKKFCHKKSLTSRHKDMEEYRILCEIDLWRSVESITQQSSSETPSEHLEYIFNNGKFHDVTITCEGNEFKAHKYLLMEMSPVFESLLCLDTKAQSRIEFKSMKSLAVREMLLFLYSGRIKNFDMLPELLIAAENYEISALKNYCTKLIKTKITKETVLAILLSAEKTKDHETKISAMEFIKDNARELKMIFTTKNWLELVEDNPDLAQEISKIINQTEEGSTHIDFPNPPAYDTIFQNQPGTSTNADTSQTELFPNKLLVDFDDKMNFK